MSLNKKPLHTAAVAATRTKTESQPALTSAALVKLDAIEGRLWAGLQKLRNEPSESQAGMKTASVDGALQTVLHVIKEIRSRSLRQAAASGATKGP